MLISAWLTEHLARLCIVQKWPFDVRCMVQSRADMEVLQPRSQQLFSESLPE